MTTTLPPAVPEPTKVSFLDRAFRWGVGGRTEIIAIALSALRIIEGLGLVAPGTFDSAIEYAGPVAGATLAAKIQRVVSRK